MTGLLQDYITIRGSDQIKLEVYKVGFEGHIWEPRPTKQQIFQVLGNVLFYREQYQEDVKLLPYDIFEEINGHQGLGIEWDGEDREWDVHRWYDSMDIR